MALTAPVSDMADTAIHAAASRPVAVQFDDAGQQRSATGLGMWMFLATETLFFGALFFAYAIGRANFADAFAAASRHTNLALGTANTAVLLTSSLFMALGVRSAALAQRRATLAFLLVTAALGAAFAGIKLVEYGLDYRDHLVPAVDFAFAAPYAPGARVFFGFYFAATGLHMLHLSVGIVIVLYFCWRVWRTDAAAQAERITLAGLYWHFVDVVWIFLYPCLYLVARS